jgi:DNA-binding ferritin-like protein
MTKPDAPVREEDRRRAAEAEWPGYYPNPQAERWVRTGQGAPGSFEHLNRHAQALANVRRDALEEHAGQLLERLERTRAGIRHHAFDAREACDSLLKDIRALIGEAVER